MAKKMTFAAAMKDYFGYQPLKGPTDFMQELRALTPEDKAWFRGELPKVGYEIVTV